MNDIADLRGLGDQPATTETVEAVVRRQLATALGGKRGMVEAAVPTIVFTVLFLTTRDLRLALALSLGAALVALAVRVVQRQTVQFAVNALFGIGIGAAFAWRAARGGGSADEQALAYFLPGVLYNAGYAAVLMLSILTRWPVVGFMVGSVTGDPTGWREDSQVRKLCSLLTWVLVAPCILRVVVQAPVYLAASQGPLDTGVAVGILGVCKLVMGWPLQLASLALMVWLLGRDRTPVTPQSAA
ncbi:DUF3159 domain-containing protein [Nocardioides sp.]|uniref:DUF3159 domain-containing protein n=1 Tax=Nocardioides sp. TaxID=35761 RepID=UPI002BEE9640|nr:DUF3159 domain-containing protein [Nocardioides sp.]HSX69158.1 DUF3159 domain-containing protein [Nocardioides sp.]